MDGLMQDRSLTLQHVLGRLRTVNADREVVTFEESAPRRATYGEVAARIDRLCAALAGLGVRPGDRVRAEVSRGAAQHHFSTRQQPLAETIGHLADRHVDELVTQIRSVPPGSARAARVLEILFDQYRGPHLAAMLEAARAAPCDWARLCPLLCPQPPQTAY